MRYSSKGKIQNIIWLDVETTLQYNELAKAKGKASNVFMAEILTKAIEAKCETCNMPKLVCTCVYHTCKWCKQQFIKGFSDSFCSEQCAKAWWNS